MREILQEQWFFTLDEPFQKLISISVRLYERELTLNSDFDDYSFIIFPMAKAYEGILKKTFLDMDLIDRKTYLGKRFRVGKAINPDVHMNSRDQYWLFDDIEQICSATISRQLWETWLHSRNKVFHYYPDNTDAITLEGVKKHLIQISDSIQNLMECQW